jgi:hypothetical protein
MLELSEKRYVILKMSRKPSAMVAVRCCRRAMATGEAGIVGLQMTGATV